MTKKEMVKELINLGSKESESKLMQLKNSDLEDLIESAKAVKEDVEVEEPEIDIEKLKAQMMEDLKAELREEAKAEIMKEMEVSKSEDSIPEPVRKRKKQIDKSELVEVMNVTNGELIYVSKRTGALWNFERYGDTEFIELQELLSMRSGQRRFLDEPWLLILDEDVVEYMGLTKTYEKIVDADNIDSIFMLSQEKFESTIESAPRGIIHLIVSRAKELIDNQKLDSFRKIEFMENRFKIELKPMKK